MALADIGTTVIEDKNTPVVCIEHAKNIEVYDRARRLIMEGLTVGQCCHRITKEFGMKANLAMLSAKKALRDIQDEYADKLRESAQRNWLRLEQLYQDAVESGDRRLQLEVIREENRMTGVYNENPSVEQTFIIKIGNG